VAEAAVTFYLARSEAYGLARAFDLCRWWTRVSPPGDSPKGDGRPFQGTGVQQGESDGRSFAAPSSAARPWHVHCRRKRCIAEPMKCWLRSLA
jgi:hypothetical protein